MVKAKYGDRAQLLFTDTDSLMYDIATDDVYKEMWEQKDLYDFADYPTTHVYHDKMNNKVIGKFKDETKGDPIVEFVGLRPKMYSYQTRPQATGLLTDKHRAKGIQAAASSTLRHVDFLDQLRDPKENRLPNRRIGNHFHHLYTIQVTVTRNRTEYQNLFKYWYHISL